MTTWRRIACPVDFSATSRAALEEAGDIAQRARAELFVVHVQHPTTGAPSLLAPPPPREASGAPGSSVEEQLQSWTRDAQQRAPGLVTSLELGGDPATEIIRFADEFSCDLIVMGTHGRTGLRHLALGSVTEKVIRGTCCPVLVVHGTGATG